MNFRNQHKNRSLGFTLIELLVVIAIIGFLSSIILVNVSQAQKSARDARRKQDLVSLRNAINTYFLANNHLPRNQTGWCTYISNAAGNYGIDFKADLTPQYISTIPLDPKYANGVGDYFYYNEGNTNGDFTLCALLENSTGNSYDYTACYGGTVYNYCITQR